MECVTGRFGGDSMDARSGASRASVACTLEVVHQHQRLAVDQHRPGHVAHRAAKVHQLPSAARTTSTIACSSWPGCTGLREATVSSTRCPAGELRAEQVGEHAREQRARHDPTGQPPSRRCGVDDQRLASPQRSAYSSARRLRTCASLSHAGQARCRTATPAWPAANPPVPRIRRRLLTSGTVSGPVPSGSVSGLPSPAAGPPRRPPWPAHHDAPPIAVSPADRRARPRRRRRRHAAPGARPRAWSPRRPQTGAGNISVGRPAATARRAAREPAADQPAEHAVRHRRAEVRAAREPDRSGWGCRRATAQGRVALGDHALRHVAAP